MKPVNVGILGLGTVGRGTFDVLQRNGAEIARRIGREIRTTVVAERDQQRAKIDTSGVRITDDAFGVVKDPQVDIVVELIGGDTIAKDLVMQAIDNGKHVVTANKAMVAKYGNEIFAAAGKQQVRVEFEAAVAGGIPIIKAVREGLGANRIEWLAGIINGTGNFILSEMRDKGRDFDSVLAEAQSLGYAEADPTFDVEGIDAAHKLTLLASMAFGIPLSFDDCYTEGISGVTQQDITYAEELGYTIKHLGITAKRDQGVELRVHPTLIPHRRLIANVDGVMNAVLVQGDAVGPTLYYGAGAGSEPTASAVVADVVDIARTLGCDYQYHVPPLAFQPAAISDLPILKMEAVESAYYLRLTTEDNPKVMAEISRILGDCGISIDVMIRKEPQQDSLGTTIILLTRKIVEAKLNDALSTMAKQSFTKSEAVRIRVEQLQ